MAHAARRIDRKALPGRTAGRSGVAGGPAGEMRPAKLRPILGQHRVPLVIAPAPGDLHVAPRIAFAGESDPLRKRKRARVGGLDVDLDAVEPQLAERDV